VRHPAACGARTGSSVGGYLRADGHERSIPEGRQAQVRGDAGDVGCAVEEAFELTGRQFRIRQRLLPIEQFLIDALDRGIVRRNPCSEVGQFRSKRRIDLSQLGSQFVALSTASLLLLRFHLAKPLSEPMHDFVQPIAPEGGSLHLAPG
jgi:hypothetical protein